MTRHLRTFILFVGFSVVAGATTASAQTQARVLRDNTIIWRADVSIPAASVRAGTVLEVKRTVGEFLEVLIPAEAGGRGDTGRIALAAVEIVGPASDTTRVGAEQRNPSTPRAAIQPPSRPGRSRGPFVEPNFGVRGVGEAGVTFPAARHSFETVAGGSAGFTFGGGLQVRFRSGMFVEGTLDQVKRTGERVIVVDGTAFKLDIPDTVTIRPLMVDAGYRFSRTRRMVPYVGGGIGTVELTERTPFSDDSEVIHGRHTGYRFLGGIEFRGGRWFATAIQGSYTRVPHSLGDGGVSEVFDEHDLGGMDLRVKMLLGR